jgi:hypothetical protein
MKKESSSFFEKKAEPARREPKKLLFSGHGPDLGWPLLRNISFFASFFSKKEGLSSRGHAPW